MLARTLASLSVLISMLPSAEGVREVMMACRCPSSRCAGRSLPPAGATAAANTSPKRSAKKQCLLSADQATALIFLLPLLYQTDDHKHKCGDWLLFKCTNTTEPCVAMQGRGRKMRGRYW